METYLSQQILAIINVQLVSVKLWKILKKFEQCQENAKNCDKNNCIKCNENLFLTEIRLSAIIVLLWILS